MTIFESIAVIPARAGSKGLPGKNYKSLCGKPLVDYTITAAVNSKIFSKIILSTDLDEIIEKYANNSELMIHNRNHSNAADDSSIFDLISEISEYYNISGQSSLMLLQPTSPLRITADIINCYEIFRKNNFHSVISVSEPLSHPSDCLKTSFDGINLIHHNDYVTLSRQNFSKFCFINGAVYISTFNYIISNRSFVGENTGIYWMPKSRSIDIDDYHDFYIAEAICRMNQNHT